jgi:hypothetical protein
MKVRGNSIIFGSFSINSLAWVDVTKTKFKKHFKGKLSEEQIEEAWKVVRSSR